MSNIKLLRNGASARGRNPGAFPSPAPAPRSPLGPDWWTAGWDDAVRSLDERCQALVKHLRRDYGRVRDFSDPLGTVFSDFPLEEQLPLALWQAILRIPDDLAGNGIVLRKVKDGDGYAVRVCDPHGATIGMLEPGELTDIDHWLSRCANWMLANLGATPESITRLLDREVPTK